MCGSLVGIPLLKTLPTCTGMSSCLLEVISTFCHLSSHDIFFLQLIPRLCIAFLTFSCIGYAMPFILCATICCCLPCIISVLGYREDLGHTRGATSESINALPTYKFKSKRSRNHEESGSSSEGPNEGGIFAPGTDKERIVSAEDAVSFFLYIHIVFRISFFPLLVVLFLKETISLCDAEQEYDCWLGSRNIYSLLEYVYFLVPDTLCRNQ